MVVSVLAGDLKDRLVYKSPQPGLAQTGVSSVLGACFRFACIPIDYVNQKTFDTAQLVGKYFGKNIFISPGAIAKVASTCSLVTYIFNGSQTHLGYAFKAIQLFAHRAHSIKPVENLLRREKALSMGAKTDLFLELSFTSLDCIFGDASTDYESFKYNSLLVVALLSDFHYVADMFKFLKPPGEAKQEEKSPPETKKI